jgi:uncharacterized protein YcbX
MSLTVGALWRYPVKTLAGERLVRARLTEVGVEGDRLVRVLGPEGVRTSRRHHRLLGLRGSLDAQGRPLVNGLPWNDPRVLVEIRRAAGDDAWLEAAPEDERFDVLPLLVITDGAVTAFGRDVRRLRPNLVIAGVEGLDERTWAGAELHIGPAIVGLDSLRARCVMTTVDPDTLARDPEVLCDIGRRFKGRLALNARVLREGQVYEGDRATLVRHKSGVATAEPTR